MGGRGKVIEKSTKREAGRRMANTEPRAQVISNDATLPGVCEKRAMSGIFCPFDIQWR